MANGSYYPGEGIHLKIRFQHGGTVQRITATFAYEKDDAEIVLSGVPNRQNEDEWLAILSARAADKRGAYHCVDLRAEYEGDHEIAFRTRTSLQDIIFSVVDTLVWAPVLIGDWE